MQLRRGRAAGLRRADEGVRLSHFQDVVAHVLTNPYFSQAYFQPPRRICSYSARMMRAP
jgi:hypothetical protein